ncbi:ATP-binding cassette, subfamily F, uup [Catalinimonas alkaloidigena]|uniref:ATP-binding cassette, subfamily F, uup n=1 Tax=Catalinimonas alkaloidigena TaxID=1075417 RepID=A0A1G9J1T5_9BACT|nr:ABC-F family ATP-binding cassette domain-containing protein [Catalinimonas alkaloidigena]SDL31315.1 ATP-binding cassette, subfamily F, uup [Catalinimonas alkaloidigena]
MPVFLSAHEISKTYGDRWLFHRVSLGVSQGDKVALVGVNGSGKSTLLKVLAGLIPPDEGEVAVTAGIRVGMMSQNPTFHEDATVLDNVLSMDHPLALAVKAYEQALTGGKAAEITAATLRMDEQQAWEFETQIRQTLTQLGVPDLHQVVRQLSGGQRKRLDLARVLLSEPDLLILDEPTNHLDLATIEWLEGHLASRQQTLLLVTHDRYFLERITNVIVELNEGQLYRYEGNYAYFLEKKEERQAQQASETDKARNLMRRELEWMRRQPKARGTKSQARIDAFYELEKKAQGPGQKAGLDLSVPTARQGKKIMEVEDLQKSLGGKRLVDDFSYAFKRKDRIGIIGPNGTGKTTFLRLLTGQLSPDAGVVDVGSTTVFGYYEQEVFDLPADKRVIDVVKETAEVMTVGKGETVSASQLLQRFQFPPARQYTPVGKLSGGEQRRIQLLRVLIRQPNFLILDEPTNDLDLITLNLLEEFLLDFEGCLLIVSHDRYFMDRLVEHLFVFEGDGKIRNFPGNYTDYRAFAQQQEATAAEVKWAEEKNRPTPTPSTAPKTSSAKKLSFKEQREYESLEAEIDSLEGRKAELIQLLSSGSENHEDLTQWAQQIETLDAELEQKTDRWLELSERAE